MRQPLRHVRLARRWRAADDQPLLFEQQRGVPLHDRLRSQRFKCLQLEMIAQCEVKRIISWFLLFCCDRSHLLAISHPYSTERLTNLEVTEVKLYSSKMA